MKGKLRAASRLIMDNIATPLPLDQSINGKTVHDILLEKHPAARLVHPTALLDKDFEPSHIFHPTIFDELDGVSILKAALRTDGSAGPSGMDACLWKRMCSSFQGASSELCSALASTARRLATSMVDPKPLIPLTSSRLIALDKCPGVRPIGIGEVARRIISKAILSIIHVDIQDTVGTNQLCAGQKYSCEAAIHALDEIFEMNSTEAVLLIDASNAFNNLNRQATLRNVQQLCPPLANILINTYRQDPELYIDGKIIFSKEGTTQGDPLAMAMYAIGILPLILQLKSARAQQIWYADDSSAGGKLAYLRSWWDRVTQTGPNFGYFVNASKSILIVKGEHHEEAKKLFEDSKIHITTLGSKYLGSTIGNTTFKEVYVSEKVAQWKQELESLAEIAASQPQAAYTVLTQSIQHKWLFLSRSTRNINHLLQPIEDVLRHKLIPAITGKHHLNDADRSLFSLSQKLGGLGIKIPTEVTQQEFDNSLTVTKPLILSILEDVNLNIEIIREDQHKARQTVHQSNKEAEIARAEVIVKSIPSTQQRAVSLAQERGSSSWLTTLPIEEHGFALHKGAFRDALALRYGWRPSNMAMTCVCGKSNDVQHALSCRVGGLPIHRHNDIRDLSASLISEVCTNTEIEPTLQPLTGKG